MNYVVEISDFFYYSFNCNHMSLCSNFFFDDIYIFKYINYLVSN